MQTRFLRFFSSFLLLLIAAPAALSAAAAFPYPQNRTYPYGSKPVPFGANAAADAATILSKYNTWKSGHVVSAGAGMLRVQRDSADGNDTVSEGVSYGMILAVYFNDQTTYDQLWAYKQSKNDAFGLMNWQISSGGGVIGANSAADADQDIAYSLYLANNQWGSGGTLNYKALADAETVKLIAYDLDTNRVKPGDSFNSCRYPSYFFPNEYRIFAKEKSADAATWNAVRGNVYTLEALSSNNSTGLVPEQVNDSGSVGGCSVTQGSNYYYNSCRVPLRLAIDYVYYNDPTAASELALLGGFFNGAAGGPGGPSSVVDCYTPGGATCGSYNSGAFVGPAATAMMRTGSANLQTYYNYLMADGTYPTRYFDGALGIWSLLLLSGNLPNIGDPSTIFTPTPSRTVTPYAGTPTFTSTVTPVAFAYIFEDFENAILVNSYNYTGPAAGPTLSSGINSAQKFNGNYSDLIQVALPVAGNYGGHGFDSSYAPASGVMDFTGATAVRFYVRSDKAVSIRISFREGAGINGGDDEVYDSIYTAIPGTNTWTAVNIPINATNFKENPYNFSCNPGNLAAPGPCATAGNNVFNLGSIKAAEISFNPIIGAPAANVYIDDIAFIPAVVPTMTPTKTPFANPFTLIYDDFENAASLAAGTPLKVTTYANTALSASAAWSLESVAPLVGTRSGRLDYNLGTAGTSYGAGGGFVSPYYTGTFTSPNAMIGRSINATGAVSLTMWIKADVNLKFRLTFQEAGTLAAPIGGSDGESWYSALYTGTGAWQKLTVDISDFVEDPYNTLCNPTSIAAPGPCITGGSAGNNTPNLNAIWQVGLKLPGEQVGVASRTGTVYLDDVAFITSWRSPTASPSATPGLASPTSTITPSPSPSASPTSSPTRTATASATATRSASPSATPSASATPLANTATSTPTPSASATRSASPTPTPSATPSATGTATRSSTPSASPSATRTASPSQTPTWTTTVVLPTWTCTNTPLPGSTFTDTSTTSPTRSVSPSISPTFSFTTTASSTATPTRTVSPSATGSFTGTATRSLTPTDTASVTLTLSSSPSQSRTPTPSSTVVLPSATSTNTPLPGSTFTDTSTVSPTFSSTLTVTPSRTPSSSVTPSATPSATPSFSSTGTPVQSSTASVTPSQSSTPVSAMITDAGFTWSPNALTVSTGTDVTWAWAGYHDVVSDTGLFASSGPMTNGSFDFVFNTAGTYRYYCGVHGGAGGAGMSGIIYVLNPTPSVTPTYSASPLPTSTGSPTRTLTPSVTATLAASTGTPTRTLTPMNTGTGTSTRTAQPTATQTDTPLAGTSTPAPHNTWTPDASSSKGPILSTLPVPNPGPHAILVELNKPVDHLVLKIYTKSMMCVQSVESGASGAGWVTLPLPLDFLSRASTGAYYYVVTAARNGSQSRALGTGKLVILR